MSEMKPCPFCGADNGYVDVIPNQFSNDIYSRGHCIKCHAVGTFYMQSYLEEELQPSFEQMAQMATERWNTRPIEDALQARIAELESLVERLIEIGDWATIGMVISNSYSLTSKMRKLAEDRHDEWRMLVKGWKSSKQKEAYDLDEYKDNPEESEK